MSVAARETFGPFNDDDYSPFYAADGLSPEETWERLAERVVDATACAIGVAMSDGRLSQSLVCDVHEHIFGVLFSDLGGRMRAPSENVQYSIVLAPGCHRTQVGTGGKGLPKRIWAICAEFNAAVDAAFQLDAPDLGTDLVFPAIRAYAKLLAAHPFSDGNGRTCYVLLQFALIRIGLVAVALDDFGEHQAALGTALRRDGKQSYLQLQDLVSDKIRGAQV